MLALNVRHIRPQTLASRRGFLGVSLGLTAPLMKLGSVSAGPTPPSTAKPTDTAVIQIWLGGGPSQYETYDMKPNAPQQIRGPFRPISTNVPGLQICELLPKQAQRMHRFAVLRSVSHDNNIHHSAVHWMQTGHYGPPSKSDPKQTRPSIGSVVSALRGPNRNGMVPYAHIASDPLTEPTLLLNFGPAYLGTQHAPLRIKPARIGKHAAGAEYFNDLVGKPVFEKPSLQLLSDVSLARLESRAGLIRRIDRKAKQIERNKAAYDGYRRQALELLGNPQTRRAFDLSLESPRLRERYGRNMWGQAALLCRRLVEAGVTFITLNTDAYSLAWDSHYDLEREFKKMLPIYDQMLCALVDDLVDRGLYQRVLLLVAGEFGRTAKINKRAGRDHWGKAGVALLGGAGIPGGKVIGATDARGEIPISRPVSPGDLLASVYQVLGIDARCEFHDEFGRPYPVLSEGAPVSELVG